MDGVEEGEGTSNVSGQLPTLSSPGICLSTKLHYDIIQMEQQSLDKQTQDRQTMPPPAHTSIRGFPSMQQLQERSFEPANQQQGSGQLQAGQNNPSWYVQGCALTGSPQLQGHSSPSGEREQQQSGQAWQGSHPANQPAPCYGSQQYVQGCPSVASELHPGSLGSRHTSPSWERGQQPTGQAWQGSQQANQPAPCYQGYPYATQYQGYPSAHAVSTQLYGSQHYVQGFPRVASELREHPWSLGSRHTSPSCERGQQPTGQAWQGSQQAVRPYSPAQSSEGKGQKLASDLQEQVTVLRKLVADRNNSDLQLERLETVLKQVEDLVEVAKPAARHSGGPNQHHVYVCIYSLYIHLALQSPSVWGMSR